MKTYFRIISIVLAFAFLSGCEKPQEGQSQGKDPDPIVNPDPLDPAARVVRVITEYTAGGHNVSDISYDSKGRMTKLTGGMFLGAEGVCNIEYNDASNTATAKFGDESMVMELDDSGRCINDGSWRYTYFGGHLVSSQSINGSSTWSYSWENDCLTDINYKTKATSGITYDTHDNPFYGQSYDPFCSIDQGAFTEAMCLCFCAMSSKKLYKSYYGTDFSYTFSEDGRLKEAMMSYDGVPQAIFYASYSDETPRQPRDEKAESLPSYLKGDWVITGRVEGGSEIPGFNLFTGWGDIASTLETSIFIYRLQEGSLQTLPIGVNGNNAKYFNGVLSGVIGEPYNVDYMKDNIVYKSEHLHLVGYDGEWKEGLKITKINDNKFYCKDLYYIGPDTNVYVYERVTELSEAAEDSATEIQPGSIFIFNDAKDGICNLAILEQGLSIDETTGELSGTGNTVYFILPSNDGGEDELAAGTYSSSNSTIKAESMIFTSPEEFAKMSGKAISDATLNVTRETRSEEIYYSGNFEFYADGKKYSGSFKDLKNSVMHKEINPPEPTPENVVIRLTVESSGSTKSSLSNGNFNLEQGDIVYVNASPTAVQMNGNESCVIVPYNEKGYDIVYPSKDYDGSAPLLRTYYLDDGIKYSINMPYYTRGTAEPVCMGHIADSFQSACNLRIMTGLLSVTLADDLDASKIELTADNYLEGVFEFKVTNHDYSNCTITHDSTPSAGIIIDVAQSSSRTFYFNLMPGSYKIGIKVLDKNDQILVQKSTTSEIPVERAHMVNLGILQIEK